MMIYNGHVYKKKAVEFQKTQSHLFLSFFPFTLRAPPFPHWPMRWISYKTGVEKERDIFCDTFCYVCILFFFFFF